MPPEHLCCRTSSRPHYKIRNLPRWTVWCWNYRSLLVWFCDTEISLKAYEYIYILKLHWFLIYSEFAYRQIDIPEIFYLFFSHYLHCTLTSPVIKVLLSVCFCAFVHACHMKSIQGTVSMERKGKEGRGDREGKEI